MTNISNWPKLIHKATVKGSQWENIDPSHKDWKSSYVMLPFDEYQMGNLLGLLKRSHDHNNGDWYDEIISLIAASMDKLGIEKLVSNFGDEFGPADEIYNQVWAVEKDDES